MRSPPSHHSAKLLTKLGSEQMIGRSPAFLAQLEKMLLYAHSDANVVITGETGTGKEVCARALHHLSRRAGRALVAINSGRFSVELMDNEFFGHAACAYTGAGAATEGLLHEAHEGTLFIDEFHALTPPCQIKLLRFLDSGQIRRIGSRKVFHADVRVLAATNIELEQAVREGRIREDFLQRLSVLRLHLPPLRERTGDIELLARSFLAKFARKEGKQIIDFAPVALKKLLSYHWPGNVRELANKIERAVILAEDTRIQPEDIELSNAASAAALEPFKICKKKLLAEFEPACLKSYLQASSGNISKAASIADMDPRVFRRMMRGYGL